MTVLPNSFERYTFALRILTSLSILKHGLTQKHLRNLSKIYTAESFYRKDFTEATNIQKFSLNLLFAVAVIKFKQNKTFEFEVDVNKNFLINKNIFTVLILNLCKECEKIYISAKQNQITVSFKGNYKKSLSALKKLKGFYFYSLKTGDGKIVIPAQETSQNSSNPINEWGNIFDRFSPVNLFFENIL